VLTEEVLIFITIRWHLLWEVEMEISLKSFSRIVLMLIIWSENMAIFLLIYF